MTVVADSKAINASLPATWAQISDLTAVVHWHPGVRDVAVLTEKTSGIGAAREVTFQNGNSVVERVIDESEEEYSTMDMTGSPMLRSARVTIITEALPAGDTLVTFSIDYHTKYGPIGWLLDVAVMRRMFAKVFDGAIAGLAYHLDTGEVVADSVPTG